MEGRLSKLTTYINEFTRIKGILESQGVRLPEDMYVTQLLKGLSDRYKAVVINLNMMDDLTLEEAYFRLETYNTNNHMDEKRQNRQIKALRADQKDQKEHGRSKGCYNCGRTNHHERQCRAKCKICGASGENQHTRFACPERKRNKGKTGKQNSRANAAIPNDLQQAFNQMLTNAIANMATDRKFDSNEVVGHSNVAKTQTKMKDAASDQKKKENDKAASTCTGLLASDETPLLDSGCTTHCFTTKGDFDMKTLKKANGSIESKWIYHHSKWRTMQDQSNRTSGQVKASKLRAWI